MNINSASLGIFAILIPLGILLVNFICAVGIWTDADKRNVNDRPIRLLPTIAWTILGLICGLPALALYWAVHYLAVSTREQA